MSRTYPGAFSREERAVIDHWFRKPDESPHLKSSIGRFLESQGLWPDRISPTSTCSAFIGRLALASVEERLPQKSDFLDDIALPSRRLRGRAERLNKSIQLLPRLLLEINWVNRASEIGNPCVYYATWLPGYYRWVVTVSTNACPSWNHWDRCIGWFSDTNDFLACVHGILLKEWRCSGISPKTAWEVVGTNGVVDETLSYRWRKEAWPDSEEVDMESVELGLLPKAEVVRIDSRVRKRV